MITLLILIALGMFAIFIVMSRMNETECTTSFTAPSTACDDLDSTGTERSCDYPLVQEMNCLSQTGKHII